MKPLIYMFIFAATALSLNARLLAFGGDGPPNLLKDTENWKTGDDVEIYGGKETPLDPRDHDEAAVAARCQSEARRHPGRSPSVECEPHVSNLGAATAPRNSARTQKDTDERPRGKNQRVQ